MGVDGTSKAMREVPEPVSNTFVFSTMLFLNRTQAPNASPLLSAGVAGNPGALFLSFVNSRYPRISANALVSAADAHLNVGATVGDTVGVVLGNAVVGVCVGLRVTGESVVGDRDVGLFDVGCIVGAHVEWSDMDSNIIVYHPEHRNRVYPTPGRATGPPMRMTDGVTAPQAYTLGTEKSLLHPNVASRVMISNVCVPDSRIEMSIQCVSIRRGTYLILSLGNINDPLAL